MPDAVAVLVPQMNVNDDNAVIVAWQVANGGHVASGAPIATLETTKATFDVNAEREGYVFYEHEPKSVVAVGAVLAWLSDSPATTFEQLKLPATASAPGAAMGAADVRFTRKALRRMQELGVAVTDFPATGRIEIADVERVAAEKTTRRAQAPQVAVAAPASDAAAPYEPLEQSSSKVMEAVRLSDVYRNIVPSMVTVPVSAERIQAKLAELAGVAGPVSLLELAIREVAAVLADYPDLKGFHAKGRAYTYREVSIGFAVNAGKSLRVPVVRDVPRLSQLDVSRAVRDLTLRYFREELLMADVSGGSFTITDLSGYGVTHFVPVLNDRQSAILGICAPLSPSAQNLVLGFDHRMSDGMRAAAFLGELRERLES
ncbi:MAG: 2-oxo acid dehydrogenase subunit E2 [Gammaproteobacteria bacterium]